MTFDQDQVAALLFVFIYLYFAEHALMAIGVLKGSNFFRGRKSRAETALTPEHPPHVTVLVCARDEEDNIGRCLESLSHIKYPHSHLQLLVVDDKSSDATPAILAEWQEKLPHLTVLRTGEEAGNLRGKVNALAQGMDAATGEFVMITDADATVKPNWVNEYLRYYDKNVGMVASITLLDVDRYMDGVQSIDWSYLLGIALASSNLKIPLSVIGNNMSVRKAAYESVGGYRAIPFSVTEDYALYQAIWKKRPWSVRFPVSSDLLVMSRATPTLKAWWRQKHRWVKGGQSLKALGWFIFIMGLAGNIGMVLAPILGILGIIHPLSAAFAVLLKWSADLLVILPILASTRMNYLIRYFFVYELYLFLFVISMPVMIMQRNVVWKGRVYKH